MPVRANRPHNNSNRRPQHSRLAAALGSSLAHSPLTFTFICLFIMSDDKVCSSHHTCKAQDVCSSTLCESVLCNHRDTLRMHSYQPLVLCFAILYCLLALLVVQIKWDKWSAVEEAKRYSTHKSQHPRRQSVIISVTFCLTMSLTYMSPTSFRVCLLAHLLSCPQCLRK